MIYRYWIEFDEEGDIKSFHKTKKECKNVCQEFIVKLIPIDRSDRLEEATDKLNKEVDAFSKNIRDLKKTSKKMSTELDKIIHKIKI